MTEVFYITVIFHDASNNNIELAIPKCELFTVSACILSLCIKALKMYPDSCKWKFGKKNPYQRQTLVSCSSIKSRKLVKHQYNFHSVYTHIMFVPFKYLRMSY